MLCKETVKELYLIQNGRCRGELKVSMIISDVNECDSMPCQNNGTCNNTEPAGTGNYTCQCQPGYTGIHCETGMWRNPCRWVKDFDAKLSWINKYISYYCFDVIIYACTKWCILQQFPALGNLRHWQPGDRGINCERVTRRNLCRWMWDCDMMTSSNGNIFRVTGHLCGKFTGPR